jgi:hypothetical protein
MNHALDDPHRDLIRTGGRGAHYIFECEYIARFTVTAINDSFHLTFLSNGTQISSYVLFSAEIPLQGTDDLVDVRLPLLCRRNLLERNGTDRGA